MKLVHWKHGFLRPDTHDPGIQRGFGMSAKGHSRQNHKSEHSSRSAGTVAYWQVGHWAGGLIKH